VGRALLIVEPAAGPARGAARLARGALGLAGAESGPAGIHTCMRSEETAAGSVMNCVQSTRG
jgi:hypothetical protein